MPSGVYVHQPKSEETRLKMSNSHKGKGHKLSEEHKEALRLSHLGKKMSESNKEKLRLAHLGKHYQTEEGKLKISMIHKGKPLSEEHKKKLSELKKGIKHTKEHSKRISEANKGISKNKGRILSEETKQKISKANKGVPHPWQSERLGEKSANWQGGKSFEPYSVDWNETLRRSIRERDKYLCQVCHQIQGDRALSVHHIDYNKLNNNPENLISLCIKCHVKTNKNRQDWTNYFRGLK